MNSYELLKSEYEVSFKDNENFEIRLSLYKPNPEQPGMLILDRNLTNAEVKEQIVNTLRKIALIGKEHDVLDAYQCMEKLSYIDYVEQFGAENPFPYESANIAVSCGYGHNDGNLINIMARNPKSGDYNLFCSIKFILTMQDVSKIAIALNEAFNNGRFN